MNTNSLACFYPQPEFAFKEANNIFDYLIGINYFNSLFGSFIFPAFLFLPFPIYFKLMFVSLYVLSLAIFCFVITVYNDRFLNKVSTPFDSDKLQPLE